MNLASISVLAFLVSLGSAPAAILFFDLQGIAGTGLLPGNELHVVNSGGTGGETGTGISYDTDTKMLTVNVIWGSANGFTDLSGPASAAHIHGPAGQNDTAGVLVGFSGFNTSASAGSISTVIDASSFEAALLAGNTYINVHTAANGAGEIRGNLVPEPSIVLLGGLGAFGLIRRRRQA